MDRTTTLLKVQDIQVSERVQIRESISDDTVTEYVEALRRGAQFPPVTVFEDADGTLLLADGWHRLMASMVAGREDIECVVHSGGLRDAQLFAVGTNAEHGLPRTRADKRRAVMLLLSDPEWSTWSDRKIAAQCHVTHPFVARVRSELRQASDTRTSGNVTTPDTRTSGNVTTPDTRTSGNVTTLTGNFATAKRPDTKRSSEVPRDEHVYRDASGRVYTIHPVLDFFPVPEDVIVYLTKSINKMGLLHHVDVWLREDGSRVLVDGRLRWQALERLGRLPEDKDIDTHEFPNDKTAGAFVMLKNYFRMHHTLEDQARALSTLQS